MHHHLIFLFSFSSFFSFCACFFIRMFHFFLFFSHFKMKNTGSRGLGHQVATDSIVQMERAMARDKINLNDRQVCSCLLKLVYVCVYLSFAFVYVCISILVCLYCVCFSRHVIVLFILILFNCFKKKKKKVGLRKN